MMKKVNKWLRSKIPSLHSIKCYSQEGEDMILRRLFAGQAYGFYIDIGAHHPWRFSNTYYFYRQGWRGINIDAMPGSMREFTKARPQDINLEVPIAKQDQQLDFFCFNEPALNTFDPVRAQQLEQETRYRVIQKVTLSTQRLAVLLDHYLASGQVIDFMSIDVEGYDVQVLASNDWSWFVPRVILIEDHTVYLNKIVSLDHKLLQANGYRLFASTYNTNIYLHQDSGLVISNATT